jgi:hypothetical protein
MDDTARATPEDQLMQRIRGEYLEMPDLRLTCPQAQRLFGIGGQSCARVLDELVARGFLARRANGTYTRLTHGSVEARVVPQVRSTAPLRRIA